MKNLIALVFLCCSFVLTAQPAIEESKESMSAGSNNSYTFLLENTSKKIALDQWNSYMKSFKGKTKTIKNETFTDNAKMPNFSSNTVDVYAKFLELESKEATEITIWIDLGGAFMSSESHAEKTASVNQFITEYDRKVKAYNAEEFLKDQEGSLKNLEKEWTKLLKDKESYKQKIEDSKTLIAKNENLIKENESAQKAKMIEVDSQKKNVSEAKAALQKVQ